MAGVLLLSFAYPVSSAYGHVAVTGPRGLPVRIDNEQFSERVSTEGGVVTITGTLVNVGTDRIEMSPYIAVTPSEVIDAEGRHLDGVPPYYELLRFIYPPYRDQSSWYFRVDHSLSSSSVVLEPGEKIDYHVKIYPLKAGAYHVHSFFLSEKFPRLGIGQTIMVTGSSAPTTGEMTQLYLPFAIGAATFAVLMLRVVRISKQGAHSNRERIVRAYFAAKSSFETVWLAGVLFWLTMWASYLYPIGERFTFALSASAALAIIIILGYASVLTLSKARQSIFAATASGTTAAFYIALLFGDALGYSSYREPQFYVDGFVSFIVAIANSLIAIYFAIMAWKERNRSAKVAPVHQ